MNKIIKTPASIRVYKKKSLKKTFSHIGVCLTLYDISVVFLYLIMTFILKDVFNLKIDGNASIALNWILTILCQYGLGFSLFLFLMHLKKPIALKRKKITLSLDKAIVIAIICIGIMNIGSMVSALFTSFFERVTGVGLENELNQIISQTNIVVIILIVVIIGPIIEEIIYRKMILDRIRIYGENFAIVFSALIFAFAHGNFFQVFYSFGLGYLLGYLYIKTNNIKITIGYHIFVNFCGTAIPMLLSYCNSWFFTIVFCVYFVITCLVSIASLFLISKFIKNLSFKKNKLSELSTFDKIKASCINVGMIAFFALTIYNFTLSAIN